MTKIFPWKQTVVVVAASVMAVISLTVSVSVSQRLEERIRSVQASRDMRRHIFLAAMAMREAEAAQRMYVITGEDTHLSPLHAVIESLPGTWKSVRAAARPLPLGGMAPELDQLEDKGYQVLARLQLTAEVRRQSGREAALQRVESGQSQQLITSFHGDVQAVMNKVEDRIEEETSGLALAERRGRLTSLGTGGVALILGGVAIWQWRRALHQYRRELDLSAEKQRAEQMAQDKSNFLAAMSHEVRTPLNAILGMSQQLSATGSGDSVKLQAEAIQSAGRSMLQLVNDLLDFSRMESGRLQLRPSATGIRQTSRWLMELMTPLASSKGIAFSIDDAPDIPPVLWADEGRLRQILVNLVTNALKFTPSGGRVTARITWLESGDGGELSIEVEDNGCGIPPERQSIIFEPYVQGAALSNAATQSGGGVGLGLAIVRELVELMHGRISLQSQPGTGSVFQVRLPLTVPDPGRSIPLPVPAPAANASPERPRAGPPLSPDAARELQHVMATLYRLAFSTQSTTDVRNLSRKLESIGRRADCPLLIARSAELHRASLSFAVGDVMRILTELPAETETLYPPVKSAAA